MVRMVRIEAAGVRGVSLALVIVVVAEMVIELAPPTKASSLANASTF